MLSLQQVKELIRIPQNLESLRDARLHENRIKLHTKAVDSKDKASPYFTEFLHWVSDGIRLPAYKMEVFRSMCQFPLATTSLCNSIFDEYEKIFTAQDAYFDVELTDGTLKVEYSEYLQEINIKNYFKTVVFRAFQKEPNCVFVIDLPNVQVGQRPRPYFYKVAVDDIVDMGIVKTFNGTEQIGYLIYQSGDLFICIDANSYRVLRKLDTNDMQGRIEFELVSESFHGLGYTPAKMLPSASLYSDESPIARKTQMSDVLGDLDWLLFFKIAKRMYETYGPFPIFTIPESDCDYKEGENSCQSGFVSYMKADGTFSSKSCPACSQTSLVGPGSIFTKPTPSAEVPVLGEAVEITAPHIPSLDFISKEIDTLEWEIYANCVGSADETVTKEAVNAKQVQVTVEGKRNVFLRIKRDFEETQKFFVDTMGRLMYGDYYVNSVNNYGEQFLLYTSKDIAEQLRVFKEVGAPSYMINQKLKELTQAEFKNNPYEQKRSELLRMLEPFSNLSLEECLKYFLQDKYPDRFLLKLDFTKFITKFELVNGDIVGWGTMISIDTKIERLTKILLNYVTEQIRQQVVIPITGNGSTPTGTSNSI